MRTFLRGSALCVLLALIVSVPSPGSAGQTLQAVPSEPAQIMWEPDESAWSQASKDQVMKIIGDLQAEIAEINRLGAMGQLSDKAVEGIAKLHGKNGTFVAPNGKIHLGNKNIKKLFHSGRARIKNFQIRLRFVYAKEFTEVFNKKNGLPQDAVHSLIFVFSSSYMYDDKQVDPPSTAECTHVRLCECDRGRG